MQFAQTLSRLSSTAQDDPALLAFCNALQSALFGANLTTAGANLQGIYRETWDQIILEANRNN